MTEAAEAGNLDPCLSNREGKLDPEVLCPLVLLLQECREEGFGDCLLCRRKCLSRVLQDSLQVLPL